MTEQECLDRFAAAALTGLLAAGGHGGMAVEAAWKHAKMMIAATPKEIPARPAQPPAGSPASPAALVPTAPQPPPPSPAASEPAVQSKPSAAPSAAKPWVPKPADPKDVVLAQAQDIPDTYPKGEIYEIKRVTLSEGKQDYLNVHMERGDGTGGKAYFRFLLNGAGEDTRQRWYECLSKFVINLGMTGFKDTDELVGKWLHLKDDQDLKAVANVDRINAAIA